MPSCTVILELVYDDVGEAIEWLCDKFGFAERWRAGDHRAQLSFGAGTTVVTEPWPSKALRERQSVMVRVHNADAHHDHARNRGATIIQEPTDFPYGERQYTAQDLGGHHWCFSQSIADWPPRTGAAPRAPRLTECDRSPRPILRTG